MADTKISALSSGAPAQAGDEYVVARSGANYKLTLTNIAANMPAITTSANPTLSAGTANGVLYLNGSKVATSGSALTFDGSTLSVIGGNARINRSSDATVLTLGGSPSANWEGDLQFITSNNQINWRISSNRVSAGSLTFTPSTATGGATFTTPALTIDSSGNLGIGTSLPSGRLSVTGSTSNSSANAFFVEDSSSAAIFRVRNDGDIYMGSGGKAILDSSGNLGLGVTPSAWTGTGVKAFQFGDFTNAKGVLAAAGTFGTVLGWNCNYDSAWKYVTSDVAGRYAIEGNAHAWFTAPSGTAGNTITFTQAMTLDASGNLGVGNTSPQAKLHVGDSTEAPGFGTASKMIYVNGTTQPEFLARETGSDVVVSMYASTTVGTVRTATNHPLTFLTNNTERARITSGGDFLSGTTDAGQASGNGNKLISSGAVWVANAATNDGFSYYNTSAAAYRFYVGANGTISATNTSISAISDQRFKENIRDLDAGLDAILALKPRKFDWKEGKGKDKKDDRGFIAQEFEQVFPDLIDEWRDPAPEGEEPYKSVRQDLIPVLVKAIQELKAELDATKAKVAALEGA